eukprot:1145340-Pelagomonas_calceolata.AAC.3
MAHQIRVSKFQTEQGLRSLLKAEVRAHTQHTQSTHQLMVHDVVRRESKAVQSTAGVHVRRHARPAHQTSKYGLINSYDCIKAKQGTSCRHARPASQTSMERPIKALKQAKNCPQARLALDFMPEAAHPPHAS